TDAAHTAVVPASSPQTARKPVLDALMSCLPVANARYVRAPEANRSIRQAENVEHMAGGSPMHLVQQHAGLLLWAAAAKARRHGDILLAIQAETDGIALHGVTQADLPHHLAGFRVDRLQMAIEVADKSDAAGGGEHRGQEGRALLPRPDLFHVRRAIGRKLAHVLVGAGHKEEFLRACGAATTQLHVDLVALDHHAALAERNDQKIVRLVVRRGLPVMTAFRAGA